MPKIRGGAHSIKKMKDDMKRSSGGGNNIWSVKADDDMQVRFLTEPDEWFGFQEYWDDENKGFVPVAEGEEIPEEARLSLRYLASAVKLDDNRVIAVKMPKTLTNKLLTRYDKYGTIMDRDYDLIRSGKGLDTEYDVANEGPSKFNYKKYKPLNLLSLLEAEWESAHGIVSDDEDEEPRPKKKKPKKKAKKKKNKGKKGRKRGVPVVEEDDEEDEYEGDYYEEDELKKTGVPELRAIAKDFGIKTTGLRKADLIEAILEEQDE